MNTVLFFCNHMHKIYLNLKWESGYLKPKVHML